MMSQMSSVKACPLPHGDGRRRRKRDRYELGAGFDILLGFHKPYSRVLLHATRARFG